MKVKEIASIISQIENNSPKKKKILSKLYAKTGNAHRIGITGPPGAGKSSLINNLISNIREIKKTVAVICIDPTSPFSGGAVLGDRIRMLKHHSDKGVYVRSMASRNASGGLSLASSEAADVLDSFGFDFIIFETLGVGQVEIDVINEADTVAVVLVPESGDDIQMMKAGILEIADIYVINKYDRKDSDRLYRSLKNMLSINKKKYIESDWIPPILKTVATKDEGVEALFNSLNIHRNYIDNYANASKYEIRYKNKIRKLLADYFNDQFWTKEKKDELDKELNKDYLSQLSPYKFLDKLLKNE